MPVPSPQRALTDAACAGRVSHSSLSCVDGSHSTGCLAHRSRDTCTTVDQHAAAAACTQKSSPCPGRAATQAARGAGSQLPVGGGASRPTAAGSGWQAAEVRYDALHPACRGGAGGQTLPAFGGGGQSPRARCSIVCVICFPRFLG